MNQDPSSGVRWRDRPRDQPCDGEGVYRVCLPDVNHGQSVTFMKEMKNPHLLLPLSGKDVRVGSVRVCVMKLIRSDRSMHPSIVRHFQGGGR